jgi:septal ring factor EnvC (AmiA/AmiB activator)
MQVSLVHFLDNALAPKGFAFATLVVVGDVRRFMIGFLMSQMQQQGRMDRAAAAVGELGSSAQDEVLRLKTLIRQREGEVQGGKAALKRMEGEVDTAKRQLADARKRITELEAGQDRMAESRHMAEERVVAAGGDAERLASELHAAKRRVSGPPIAFIL